MSRVLIWKSAWLPQSETFVRNHARSLVEWEALCVGTSKIDSTLASDADVAIFGKTLASALRRKAFSLTGYDRKVSRFVRDSGAHLVHAHFAVEGMRIRKAAKAAELPLVVTLHGQDITEAPNAPGLKGFYYRFRLKRLFRDAALILAVSQHIADRAVRLGASPSRVTVHYLGTPSYTSGDTPPGDVDAGIVAIGRLVEKKGFSHLIRAVSLIPEADRLPVTIAGEGPLMGQLKDLAQDLGVNVDFVGAVDHTEALRLMRANRVVCIPSVRSASGDEEGLPTVAMEAGVCARPVVGYRHSGIPEVISNGITGILVEEGDVESLAAALTSLTNDTKQAHEMGLAALRRISEHFDASNQARKLEATYSSVMVSTQHVAVS